MPTAGFLRHKWPQRHPHVIEECTALTVAEGLLELPSGKPSTYPYWRPPSYPGLSLVARMGGPCLRWWWQCPTCYRRVENVYRPPKAPTNDWRCRKCHSLVYASQRYGFAHPLRKVLTHRKRVAAIKKAHQAARRWDRHTQKRHIPMPHTPPTPSPEDRELSERFNKRFEEKTRAGFQLVIEAKLGALQPATPKVFWEPCEPSSIDSENEREDNLQVLRELSMNASRKHIRLRALRLLKRHAKDTDLAAKRQAKVHRPKEAPRKVSPAFRLTQAQIDAAQAIATEMNIKFD